MNNINRIILLNSVALILVAGAITSCQKLIAIKPPIDQLINTEVFATDNSATAAVSALYVALINPNTGQYPTILPALSADELNNYTSTTSYTNYASDGILASDAFDENIWSTYYNVIYQANAALAGCQQSKTLSSTTKEQLIGEAQFIRAFSYFELVNFYGPVPLIISTNVTVTDTAARRSQVEVYQQIVSDLLAAGQMLGVAYPTNERVRANRAASQALLARVCLYEQDFTDAETWADSVIDNSQYALAILDSVFLANSTETILSLWVPQGYTSIDATVIPGPGAASPNFAFTEDFLQTIEHGDQRKENWMQAIVVDDSMYYYPFKYKQYSINSGNGMEYLLVLRLAELYLIRAEARARQNNIPGAVADINVIRARANLPQLSDTLSEAACLSAVQQERRIELFTEWGHRWFDLKRTGSITAVLGALKPDWQPQDSLYPIPLSELIANPKLTQNGGY
jgi:hypothetical protein